MFMSVWRPARLALVLGLAAVTGGCELLAPVVCTTEAVPAILVDVRDAVSGERVRGIVRVAATDGAFVAEVDTEEFSIPPGVDRDTVAFGPFPLAHERAGTYGVTIEAAGYQPWQQQGVRVRQDECHVRTEEITAMLELSHPMP